MAAVRELVDQPLKGLGELYENSLKAMLVCGLEFYLSASLVASFFQCPDETVQAEQELQTLYTLAWVPLLFSTVLVYGPKISSTIFPSPENFERNMLRCKILTWIYAFVFLIWDPDMVVKTGPSLGVSILFCVADVGRFVMDMKHLTEVEYDENGNSFIIHDKPSLQQQSSPAQQPQHAYHQPEQQYQPQENRQHPQQPQKQDENYTVHVIGGAGQDQPSKSWQNRQQSFTQPVPNSPEKQPLGQKPQAQQQQGPPAPLFGGSNKVGSRRLLGSSRKGKRGKDLGLDQSPSAIKSEYVAVLDPNAEKEAAELVAKKSFTYEF
ncbi:hypothetical protein PHYSODRAFT_506868 [Phytophthora sojae]|uniref:Uncharacterized protein n=1 Tax=Phytophthora sojae (strain P6497) TaxID=1094619 RepID=G4ZKL5_PHYSP|nr:hypothetical protein PHYSODRAFT_506868 [Phytophthora sojae]EGZ16196.1 hypothetical protein PHYSODRAFT_506868 [Phytophthora sojae]|eukprot:XP_009529945.1 hypothetical protein PHYSODRAFT_506868 [Phytophthora sojae]